MASNKFLPKHRRLSKEDEQRLRSTGWDEPRGTRSSVVRRPNWSTDRFSDPRADHGALADMSVTALRDVLRIASPAGLLYAAFDQESGEPVPLSALDLPREPS